MVVGIDKWQAGLST